MPSDTEMQELITTARIHYENAKASVSQATTRLDHIRSVSLAMEAQLILTNLETMASRPEVARGSETV